MSVATHDVNEDPRVQLPPASDEEIMARLKQHPLAYTQEIVAMFELEGKLADTFAVQRLRRKMKIHHAHGDPRGDAINN